jgi:hypothetical protein
MVPSTVQQLAILVLFVLPGTVYQVVRDHLRGPLASEQETGNRVLRAIAMSALLDSIYAIAAGPALIRIFAGSGHRGLGALAAQPRVAGVAGLVLFVLIPAGVAYGEFVVRNRRAASLYEVTPTAWDHLFRQQGSCFVRVRIKDGTWVGGWYGRKSTASAYPQTRDLFLEAQYMMKPDGTFKGRAPNTGGLYVPAVDISHLEIVKVSAHDSSITDRSVEQGGDHA